MLGVVQAALERLYPTRTWGEPDDLAGFEAGVCEHDGRALAIEWASELGASTLFRAGGSEEYCDYVYILCLGREPSLAKLREGRFSPALVPTLGPVREQYLRVCLSNMARLAAVQQIALELDVGEEHGAGRTEPGPFTVREIPRPGVYDAPLLRRFQRLVAILPAYGITHVDFGEITAPPPGFSPGRYAELYGEAPAVVNYLFYPQPSTTVVTSALD